MQPTILPKAQHNTSSVLAPFSNQPDLGPFVVHVLSDGSSHCAWQAAEEVKFEPKVMCEQLDRRQTLYQAQLENGDILIIQQALSKVSSRHTRICRTCASS